jgi:PAS domain S-box-containing protein
MKRADTPHIRSDKTGIIALSLEFSVMGINRQACRMLEIAPAPGTDCPLEKIVDTKSLAAAGRLFADAIEKKAPVKDAVICLVNASGRPFHCHVSALPLMSKHQSAIGVILSFKAIDVQNRAETSPPSLTYLPRLGYQGVVDSLPEGVFSIDREWRVNGFNKTAETLTGHARDDIIGKYCWQVFQSGSCQHNCPLADIFKNGRSWENQETTIRTHTGSVRKIRFNAGPLKTADGRVVGAVESFRLLPMKKENKRPSLDAFTFQGMIGKNAAMTSLFAMLRDVAASQADVLITGESGTGKELVARAIHTLSHPDAKTFVAVNCSALPETLLESELFGHEKGAFTGADQMKQGRFELAGNGTLFLDEIGELKPALQVKLLRVLEQKEFERVGGSSPITLFARVIAATNQDLDKAMACGRFREDLYYRLRTIPLRVPPLRERIEDIPLLVDHFINTFNLKYDKNVRLVDPKVMDFFKTYHWPGNIRELERCMEHAFVFVRGPIIFPRYLPEMEDFTGQKPPGPGKKINPDQENLVWALEKADGNRAQAAKLLTISRTSLWRKMKGAGLI